MNSKQTALPTTGQHAAAGTRSMFGPLTNWYQDLKVAAKLWLGFGLVFGIVFALGAFAALTANKLENILFRFTTVAEPMSAAAYEMEINAIGSGMGVMAYLHTPDSAFIARFNEDQAEFAAFQQRYDTVAPSAEARALGQKAGDTYEAFRNLGATLIAAKDHEVEALNRYADGVRKTDRLLGEEAPDLARMSTPARQRITRLLGQVKTDLATFSLWLTLYLETDGSRAPEVRLPQIANTRKTLGVLVDLLDQTKASAWISGVQANFETIFQLFEEAAETKRFMSEKVQVFAELRKQLDEILDEEVQIFAQQQLAETQRLASEKSRDLRLWFLGSSILVLFLATISVVIISKGILGPVRALAVGTQALGGGHLGHRLQIASKDEIGQLADAFNGMATRLQKATEHLESEVQRRTADLNETKQSLEKELSRRQQAEQQLLQAQKMEGLGTLAGGIAHDFNNMLYVMLGFTELARSSLPADSRGYQQLANVLAAGNRSKALVQKILSFSRQEAPELKLVIFESFLTEALALLRASLPPSVELTVNMEEDCGALLADGAQLEQVIVNLGVNAYQAMEEGTGSITVRTRQIDITAELAAQNIGLQIGPHVLLTMRDNGSGIAPEVLPRVMDPFFTTKPVGEGTGLGLSVAHGIITSHGGSIKLHSKPGQGTVVEIFLPLWDSDAESESGSESGN